MNRVLHFEIHAIDPEKLGKFYTDVFGWDIKEWKIPGGPVSPENRYWLVMTAPQGSKEPGISGGMVMRRGAAPKGGEPVTAFVCSIEVPNVDEYLKKIETAGGKIAVPKMAIPSMGWLAYVNDNEGNIFGLFQGDKKAK